MNVSKPIIFEPRTNKKLKFDEVTHFANFIPDDCLSLEVIHNYLSSDFVNYKFCLNEQSLECYDVMKEVVINKINDSNESLEYFEELQTLMRNLLIIVTYTPKEKGKRQHLKLFVVYQLSMISTPKIGHVRNLQFTVRKPRGISDLQAQVLHITQDLFQVIKRSEKHIYEQMGKENCIIWNLEYTGYKFRYWKGGFSAGAAVQVHYGKYLPKPVKAMLVIPTAAASLAGVSMYRHGMKQDELNFIGGQPTPVVHTLSMPNTDLKLEKV